MEKLILEILEKHFTGHDVSGALKDMCRLLDIKREDSPTCPKCGADHTKQSCMGRWKDGEEYECDDCGNVWDYNHFK